MQATALWTLYSALAQLSSSLELKGVLYLARSIDPRGSRALDLAVWDQGRTLHHFLQASWTNNSTANKLPLCTSQHAPCLVYIAVLHGVCCPLGRPGLAQGDVLWCSCQDKLQVMAPQLSVYTRSCIARHATAASTQLTPAPRLEGVEHNSL